MRAKRATFTIWVDKSSIKMPFWLENLRLAVKQCYQTADRSVKFKWDIFDDFQTMWNSCKTFFEARSLSINKKRSPRRVHPCLFLSRQFLQSTLRGVVKYLSSWMKTQVAYSSCCFLLSFLFRRGILPSFLFSFVLKKVGRFRVSYGKEIIGGLFQDNLWTW